MRGYLVVPIFLFTISTHGVCAEESVFAVSDGAAKETFFIRLTDPVRIAEARAIVSGKETTRVAVAGVVVTEPAAYNQPWQIQMAMQILGGKVVDQVHVQGMIVAKPAAHNTPWKFHLAPKTISFFTFGHPVCWGFSTKDIGDHLDKLGTPDFLPTKQWCPRGYRLSQQVHPS